MRQHHAVPTCPTRTRAHLGATRLAVIMAITALAACSDSSAAPNGGAWYDGSWLAVRGNNAGLPVSDGRGGNVREVVLLLHQDTTQASFFIANGKSYYNFQQNENPVNRQVRITAGTDTLSLYAGPTSTTGQLLLTIRRKADTLVLSNYQGIEFKLVRSR